MVRKLLNRKKLNPFSQVFTGVKHLDKTLVQLIAFDKEKLNEDIDFSVSELKPFSDQNIQYWLNMYGIHNVDQVNDVCNTLGIHNLAIQDILDVNQRPKFQEYDDYCFFSIKSILPSKDDVIESEQLSFILGKNYLVSFQENKADYFDHVRHRLREKIGLLRERSADYLLYLLLEAILDNYFKTLENIDGIIEGFEIIDINSDPSPKVLNSIELYKRQIHQIKKTITPIKEFVSKIERERFNVIDEKNIKYYSDLKDLCLTLLDSCESMTVRLDSSENLFFSVQGHRMNMIMKTLTVVTAIFIPLTFITGIYGMNFKYIPEIDLQWGYFGVWGIFVLIVIGMLIFFKRKKWF